MKISKQVARREIFLYILFTIEFTVLIKDQIWAPSVNANINVDDIVVFITVLTLTENWQQRKANQELGASKFFPEKC